MQDYYRLPRKADRERANKAAYTVMRAMISLSEEIRTDTGCWA